MLPALTYDDVSAAAKTTAKILKVFIVDLASFSNPNFGDIFCSFLTDVHADSEH
jgi:hypothetical protein